ncbi:hypothetical protein LTS02_006063 [Friedmanniomyces endolithicus]|nr:hypothetical protein LTS02_006063 [Friedmanniomyces endolithicus]
MLICSNVGPPPALPAAGASSACLPISESSSCPCAAFEARKTSRDTNRPRRAFASMERYNERPPTPQAVLHRLPDKPDISVSQAANPSKFVILISASNEVAGKLQIAKTVSSGLGCPLFQGDSLHETAAKAASVGAPAPIGGSSGGRDAPPSSGANEPRYQRMWLSKMTRTGLLFPDESRPANSGFVGFGGSSSASTSRRGSASSMDSVSDANRSVFSDGSSVLSPPTIDKPYINKPPTATYPEEARLRKANPALLVVTHPGLHSWHKTCIRMAVGEYGIGVIFVPLDEDAEPPMLRMLDPQTMTSFTSLSEFSKAQTAVQRDWSDEIVLNVDIEATVSDISEEIISGVQEIMND